MKKFQKLDVKIRNTKTNNVYDNIRKLNNLYVYNDGIIQRFLCSKKQIDNGLFVIQ